MNSLILFIENYVAGGSDKVARNLIDELEFEKLYLFVNQNNDMANLLKCDLPSNVKLIKYNLVTLVDLGEYARSQKSNFIWYYFLKIFNVIIRYPLLVFSICYFYFKFMNLQADVFIANNGGYPGGEYCRTSTIAAYLLKIKSFHIVHSLATPPFSKLFRIVENYYDSIIDQVSQVICVSHDSANKLKKIRNIKQSIKVIHNGIEKNNKKNHHLGKKIKLLNVAALYSLKNQLFLLKVVKLLRDQGFSNIELHLVGKEVESGYKQKLLDYIDNNNLDEYIFFHGFCDPMKFYYECDIFLLSSKIESFPMVTLEAMSIGMPIISTDAGGTREQINESKNGFIIKQDDINSFLDKIIFFLNNKEQIKLFGDASYERFNKDFTINMMKIKYENILGLN